MPCPKNLHRKGGVPEEKTTKKGRSVQRASSFHGQNLATVGEMLRRPRTVPDLVAAAASEAASGGGGTFWDVQEIIREQVAPPKKLTKLLLNVTIQRSLGAVHVVISPESTVEDLIAAAVRQYVKEGRRPILPSADPAGYDLHYSQFSLESLNREDKLVTLGSRNFFLCPGKRSGAVESTGVGDVITSTTTSSSCSKEVEMATKVGLPWLKFMNFLL